MKKCCSCKIEKPLQEFNKNSCRKDGLQTICKDCSSLRSKRYYSDNKAKHKEVTSLGKHKFRKANRIKLMSYLHEHPCVDCGESDPVVLQFDHLRDKVNNISNMLYHSWDNISKEIEKCEVRCANCHSRKTAKQFNWYNDLGL